MKTSERYLTPLTTIGVIVLHIGLVLALLITQPRKEKTAPMVEIEFVDIDALLPSTTQSVEKVQDKAVAHASVKSDVSPRPHRSKPQPRSKPKPQAESRTQSNSKLDPVVDESNPADNIKPKIDDPTVQKTSKAVTKTDSIDTAHRTATSPADSSLSNSQSSSILPDSIDTDAKGEGARQSAEQKMGQGTIQGTSKNGNQNSANSGVGSSSSRPIKATGAIARPAYPEISEENEEEGTVVLKVLVSPSGRVKKVSVIKSSGYKRLDNAASKAAQVGKFKATAWTEYSISVTFEL